VRHSHCLSVFPLADETIGPTRGNNRGEDHGSDLRLHALEGASLREGGIYEGATQRLPVTPTVSSRETLLQYGNAYQTSTEHSTSHPSGQHHFLEAHLNEQVLPGLLHNDSNNTALEAAIFQTVWFRRCLMFSLFVCGSFGCGLGVFQSLSMLPGGFEYWE